MENSHDLCEFEVWDHGVLLDPINPEYGEWLYVHPRDLSSSELNRVMKAGVLRVNSLVGYKKDKKDKNEKKG